MVIIAMAHMIQKEIVLLNTAPTGQYTTPPGTNST